MMSGEADRPVLLIAGEERVPKPFYELSDGRTHPWAVALLLGVADSCESALRLEFLPRGEDAPCSEGDGLDFLSWWLGGDATVTLGSGRHRWRWCRS